MNICKNKKENCNFLPFLMWGLLALFYFYQYIARSSIPTTLTDNIMAHYGLDSTGVGALLGCYYYAYTFMQVPAGKLIDKFGTKDTGAFATFACALGLALFVISSNCVLGSIGQILVGFGSAFAFLALLKCITSWFAPAQATVMTAISAAFGPIGPVVAGPAIATLAKSVDWKTLVLGYAFIGAVLALIIYFLVKDKDNSSDKEKEESSLLKDMKTLLCNPQIWLVSIYIMGLYAPISALADLWGVKFIKATYDIDTAQASVASNMIYVGVIVGCFLAGFMCNFMKSHKKVLLILCAISAIAFLGVICVKVPFSVMSVLLFVTGFGTGGTAIAFVVGTCLVPARMCGVTSGLVNMFCMLSGVILQPLLGFLINSSWDGTLLNGVPVYKAGDYTLGLTAVMIFIVIGLVSVLFLKETYKKE